MSEVALATFFWELDPLPEVMRELSDKGVGLIEVHSNAPGTHIDFSDHQQVAEVKDTLEEIPLRIASVHSGFTRPNELAWDISNPDSVIRSRAIRNHSSVITGAAVIGAGHVALHPGPPQEDKSRLQYSRDSIFELTSVAAKSGIKIAVENLPPGYLGDSVEQMKFILQDTDPEYIGMCLDTGHASLGKNTLDEYITEFHSRIIAIHWHDSHKGKDAHLFPGMGSTNWRIFLSALDENGCAPRFVLEAIPGNGVKLADGIREIESAIEQLRHPRFPHLERLEK